MSECIIPTRSVSFNSYHFPFGYVVSKRSSCGKDFDWLAGLLMLLFYSQYTRKERIRIEGYRACRGYPGVLNQVDTELTSTK
jgi:hypothetical protein